MQIEASSAGQLYGSAQKIIQPAATDETSGRSFADALEDAMRELRATVEAGERTATDAVRGQGDVQSVVEALTATEMALETAVSMRDKVVEAYQEILRMPV